MEELIAGILRLEKLSAKSELERIPVDLNSIVEKASASFKETAAQKTQSLTLTLIPGPLIVQGNALLLQEALSNLISNAIRYTPEGGHITISSKRSGAKFSVSVQDTGPGIDPAEFENLFIPFIRLSSAGNERGTGIGLSLVKLVVEQHGGQVSVQSALGEGSVFQINLPSVKELN
jgi:signal transduction histidine kinase